MTADRPATEPRTDYSDPGVTIDQLLAEGWRPDGHRNIPHTLDEDECWCNESRAEAGQGAAPPSLIDAVRIILINEVPSDEAWRDLEAAYDAALAGQGAAPLPIGQTTNGDIPNEQQRILPAVQGAAPRAEGLEHRADSQTTIRCICGYFHDVPLYQHYATQEADALLSEWLDHFSESGAADFPRNRLFARTRARLSRPSDERVPESEELR